ncbi:MAG: hypothetical protein ABIN89_27585 [Chitinophagaceae bacterium]
MQKQDLQIEVPMILSSLDNIQAAVSPHHLYGKVMEKIRAKQETVWDRIAFHIARPIVATAIILLIIVINAAILLERKSPDTLLHNQSSLSIYLEESTLASRFYEYELQDEPQ